MDDKYLVVSLSTWADMVNDPGRRSFISGTQLLDLAHASSTARDRAGTTHMPQYVIKVIPVELHQATVTTSVAPL